MTTETTPETVDLTPQWAGILPALLSIVRNGTTVESQKFAEGELLRMARLADRYVAAVKAVPNLPSIIGE